MRYYAGPGLGTQGWADQRMKEVKGNVKNWLSTLATVREKWVVEQLAIEKEELLMKKAAEVAKHSLEQKGLLAALLEAQALLAVKLIDEGAAVEAVPLPEEFGKKLKPLKNEDQGEDAKKSAPLKDEEKPKEPVEEKPDDEKKTDAPLRMRTSRKSLLRQSPAMTRKMMPPLSMRRSQKSMLR